MTFPRSRLGRAGATGMALALAGCASSGAAETAFRDGLSALEAARPAEASGHLREVRRRCGASPLGQQAVLVEAAAALRGRAGERDPQRAAVLAAAFLGQPEPPAWGVPIAESLYLMARELGAGAPSGEDTASVFGLREADGRPTGDCGPRWDPVRGAVAVPSLEGPGVAADLRRLRTRLAELEEEVERLRALLRMPEEGGG